MVLGEDKAQKFLQGETGRTILTIATGVVTLALLYAVLYCMLKPSSCAPGEECVHPGLPEGVYFNLLTSLVCGLLAGKLIALIGLPPLFGQLIIGFLLKNVIPDGILDLESSLNSMLRSIALAIIML